MAEITTTQSFSDGDTVTATKLNNIQANASVQPEAITNRSAETTVDQANDLLLMYDASATALKKVTPSDLIKAGTASNLPITGNATIGGTLGVTGASTLTGNTSVGGTLGVTGASTLTGNTSVGGTLAVTGAITASTSIINVGSGQIVKDASGNVGIGTTSPADKLDVYGTAYFHGIELGKGGQTGNRNALIDFTGDDTYTDYGFRIIRQNAGQNASTVLQTRGTGGLFLKTEEAGDIVLQTTNTERLRINSSGNVGIGTASPATQLQINSSATTYSDQLRIRNTNYGNADIGVGSGIMAIATDNSNITFHTSSNLGTTGSAVPNNERLRINSSGNVGIGTTSPSAKLQVRDGTNRNFSVVSDVNYSNAGGIAIISTNDANSAYAPLSVACSPLILNAAGSSGNVGIGTSSPAVKLDVYGDGFFQNIELGRGGQTGNRNALIDFTGDDTYADYGFRIIRGDTGANANSVLIHRGTGGFFLQTIEAGPIVFQTTSTERLRIASAGQIGIGGANYGTSGQVLTSSGASTAPSWTTITTTPAAGSITFPMLSTSGTESDNAAKRVARAWVNFNGFTATITVRGSLNVSSVTDVAVGKYTINFTVAMSDANYATLYTGGEAYTQDTRAFHNIYNTTPQTTGGVSVYCMTPDANYRDTETANVVIFR